MNEWVKAFRFGAIAGNVLALISFLLNFLIGTTVAKIQFALIALPLEAKVGIPAMGLGNKLLTVVSNAIGFSGPSNWFINWLVLTLGMGLAVVLGRLVYMLMHEQFKIGQPKSQVGRLALLMVYAGLVGGVILGTITGLPAFGVIWALVLGSVVTSFILGWIMPPLAKKNKFVENSLVKL